MGNKKDYYITENFIKAFQSSETHTHTQVGGEREILVVKQIKRSPFVEYEYDLKKKKPPSTLRKVEGSRFEEEEEFVSKNDSTKNTDNPAVSFVIWTLNRSL